jgi:hypothetical protein
MAGGGEDSIFLYGGNCIKKKERIFWRFQ